MALSTNTRIRFIEPEAYRIKVSRQVAGSKHIYAGALVGRDPAGYIKPFEPGDDFDGVANEEFYNSSSTAGALSVIGDDGEQKKAYCEVVRSGTIAYALTGVSDADAGRAVYATADDTIAFTGNADAFVGRVFAKLDSNLAMIELRKPGEKTVAGDRGSLRLYTNGCDYDEALSTSSTTKYWNNGFLAKSILGAGLYPTTGAGGGVAGEFDSVQEVALSSLRTTDAFAVSGGIRFRARLCMTDKGGDAAIDLDWGMGTLLTTNSEADLSHADTVNKFAFHMDGNSDNVNLWSENANTEVSPVDTTIDNDSATDTYKDYLGIIRSDGTCEGWINSGSGFVRVLSTTAFSVASSVALAFFINMEKTSAAAALTAKWIAKEIEITGTRSLSIG